MDLFIIINLIQFFLIILISLHVIFLLVFTNKFEKCLGGFFDGLWKNIKRD